jgi:hypothetical protein
MFRNAIIRMALAGLVTVAACAGKEEPTDNDFGALAGLEGKSDQLSGTALLLGSLSYGETSAVVSYRNPPRYRAFKFGGQKGDQVTVDVRSVNGGDAVAWVITDAGTVIGYNDDADDSTYDAHIEVTLPGNVNPDIVTYYVVFREYNVSRRGKFQVQLQGQAPSFDSCNRDSDCLKIHVGCCKRFEGAINGSQLDAYVASLNCEPNPICPAVLTQNTDRQALCNVDTHKCELVEPEDTRCGGHTLNPHACPAGWDCVGEGLAYDVPGLCRKFCGGFGNFPCPEGFECADDWRDDCDVNNGGADCGGLCMPPFCGGFGNIQCPAGLTCVDDPTDNCDVADGGADCGGICVVQ